MNLTVLLNQNPTYLTCDDSTRTFSTLSGTKFKLPPLNSILATKRLNRDCFNVLRSKDASRAIVNRYFYQYELFVKRTLCASLSNQDEYRTNIITSTWNSTMEGYAEAITSKQLSQFEQWLESTISQLHNLCGSNKTRPQVAVSGTFEDIITWTSDFILIGDEPALVEVRCQSPNSVYYSEPRFTMYALACAAMASSSSPTKVIVVSAMSGNLYTTKMTPVIKQDVLQFLRAARGKVISTDNRIESDSELQIMKKDMEIMRKKFDEQESVISQLKLDIQRLSDIRTTVAKTRIDNSFVYILAILCCLIVWLC